MSRYQCDEGDLEDARAEFGAADRYLRYHRNKLANHPDCRDPDHPGCDKCEDDDINEDEDE